MTDEFFAPSAPQQSDAAKALPAEIGEITARWSTYPCLRSERAQEIFDRLKPDLMARVAELDHPVEVVTHVDGFLSRLPAGVQVFSLFEANPQLIDLILDIASTAPHLARYLSRNAGVLEAVIGGDFFAPWPGREALEEAIKKEVARAEDYEGKLDAVRREGKDWHFRIGVHQLRGLISADEAGEQYSDLARAAVGAVFPAVVEEFSRKHGPQPGRGAMVLGMGSLGAGRLTAASDLDMIVIYDADGVDASEGPRPLASRSYYARFTQALITAMTAQTAQGRLYEVDMRLRPSGKQGPVATSLDSFRSYQREQAWVWEHLALTRATAVAGAADLTRSVEDFRADLLAQEKDEARVRRETSEMRVRLAQAKPGSTWDPKNGRGRMMDIELVAEAGALIAGAPCQDVYAQLEAGASCGWLLEEERMCLTEAYRLMWRLQSAARLLTGGTLDVAALGAGGRRFLLRSNEEESIESLSAAIEQSAAAAGDVIDRVLERAAPCGKEVSS